MTINQKFIINELLKGGSIAKYATVIRLRDNTSSSLLNMKEKTFMSIKYLLRMNKKKLYVIDKRSIRRQRKNTWVKQQYKLNKKLCADS